MRVRGGYRIGILSVFLILCGCGGGGGGATPTPGNAVPTPAPTVIPASPHVGDVRTQLFLYAGGSTLAYDPDDKILLSAYYTVVYNAATHRPTALALPANDPSPIMVGLAYDQAHRAIYLAGSTTLYRGTLTGAIATVASVFSSIQGLAVDPSGTVYVVDNNSVKAVVNGVVRQYSTPGSVPAGLLSQPAFDTLNGMLYVTDPADGEIMQVSPSGAVSVIAGSCADVTYADPTGCAIGDIAGTGPAVRFGAVEGIAFDPDDNELIVADSGNNQIWTVTPNGTATIAAGFGEDAAIDGNGRFAFIAGPLSVTYAADSRQAFFSELVGNRQDYLIGSIALAGLPAPLQTFPIQTFAAPPAVSEPTNIALAPDDSVWISDGANNAAAHISATANAVEVPLTGGWQGLDKIVVDAGGTLWGGAEFLSPGLFPTVGVGGLVKIGAGGAQTGFLLPSGGTVTALAIGPNGNVWYGEFASTSTSLGEIDQTTVIDSNFTIQSFFNPPRPQALIAGPDGNLWYATNNAIPLYSATIFGIAEMTPAGALVPGMLQTPTEPNAFARDALDGAVWYIDAGTIWRIAPGASTPTSMCVCLAGAFGISAAPDGSMWVVDQIGLERIDPTGSKKHYELPDYIGISGVAVRSDGKVWAIDTDGPIYLLDPVAYDAGGFPHAVVRRQTVQIAGLPRLRRHR